MDGRLHLHMTLYVSAFTPGLLTRIAGCADLQPTASAWLDGVSCTRVSDASYVRTQQQEGEGGTEHARKRSSCLMPPPTTQALCRPASRSV